MPNAPKTPTRTIRIENSLWRAAQDKATERSENVSDVVRRALLVYVDACPHCGRP